MSLAEDLNRGTVKRRPTKPAPDSSKVVKLEALQQIRAEHDEFLRRFNKALSLQWRAVRPHDEHGHGDPAVDWVSRNGHIMLEHSDGVRLLLKRFGQAQLFKHAEPPNVIERNKPDVFDDVLDDLGPASYEDHSGHVDKNWIWPMSVSFFSGCAALVLLMKTLA